jgi:hypothetical protein
MLRWRLLFEALEGPGLVSVLPVVATALTEYYV